METKLTKRELLGLLESIPDDGLIMYHSYDHGLCLNSYRVSDAWLFPKSEGEAKKHLVLNPGNDWDHRGSAERA